MADVLKMQKAGAAGNPFMAMQAGASVDLSAELSLLVQIYDKTDRPVDVLYLVEEVPWWNTPALTGQAHSSLFTPVAKMLYVEGKKDKAVALLKQHLMSRPEQDDAYEALVTFDVDGLSDWLDLLYARDRFEERPLIWKAVLQKQEGKLDEAERTIRQALKVDPTDGETEAGSRVRAYAVLAEVLEAQGKQKDADFFSSVVRSVRTAERGDAFTEAGLTSMSLELYEQAEQDFVDAYCVQWRLAERLYAMGRHEEAEKHYAIAF